jgi:hypothetical protein
MFALLCGPAAARQSFYTASADTNIVGGSAYVKIPLNYTPRAAFAARY